MNDNTALVPLADTMELGKLLAASGFFEDSRQASQAVVKVLAGREIGIGPIASMTGIYIIKGKPAIGAGLMASIVKRSGKYDYVVRKLDGDSADIEFFEKRDMGWRSIGVSVFTRADAVKAGTQNLEKYARNMLFARCISNGVKWYCPDVFQGPIYTPEELGAPVTGEGEVIDVIPHVVTQQPTSTEDGNGHAAEPVPAPPWAQDEPKDKPQDEPKITDKQRREMFAVATKVYGRDKLDEFRTWIHAEYGVESTNNLTARQGVKIIDLLRGAAQSA
jgi:hypothetical protein